MRVGPPKVDYLAGKKLQNYLELVLVLSITLGISSKNTKFFIFNLFVCIYISSPILGLGYSYLKLVGL
jgi:hypothetical protein